MTIAGVLTAGSAGTVVGAAYDVASTSVGSERAIKLTNAECAYDVAASRWSARARIALRSTGAS